MNFFDPNALLSTTGPYAPAAVFAVMFAESSLPIGFVLPGDTLLFTVGLVCAAGILPLPWMLAAAASGAVLGAHAGLLLGRLGSRALSPRRPQRHVVRAVERFERLTARRGFGPALVAARFIPLARSATGPLSGLLRVPVARFTGWATLGGLAWTGSLISGGYLIGRVAPGLERFVPEVLMLAALSFPVAASLGFIFTCLRARRALVPTPPTAPMPRLAVGGEPDLAATTAPH
ncbi:DedA family protein [Actinospica robiniae]|uniref:DedA family protein n=1 Tax=Actinospica robiniae TaxID=304901 RepID=UPI0003F88DB3|nr:DedA family protein [Actinospica robiniae]